MLLVNAVSWAQPSPCDRTTYDEFVLKAQNLVEAGDYIQAFQYYNSAKDYCPQEGAAVDVLVEQLIAKIAEDQQAAEEAKQTAEAALTQAQKLIDPFYFYDDKFALAFKDNRFYFIDKNGDEVERLGRWEKAEQFDGTGFAKVRQGGKDWLLDTTGSSFPVAYTISTLDSTKTAYYHSGTVQNTLFQEILQHPQLEVLILNGTFQEQNFLYSFPEEITQLSELQSLQLKYCQLVNIPEEIGNLTKLTSLNLFGNYLSTLPEGFGDLTNLTSLNLAGNQLKSLPEGIGNLYSLTSLNLGGNRLNSLPERFDKLTNLIILDITANKLSTLPKELEQLINLTELDLGFNQLSSLPEWVGELTNLTYLNLCYNQLGALPERIGDLTNLTTLYLYDNQLIALPERIGELANLTNLILNDNQLTSLPDSFGQLTNLTILGLSDNQLNILPENFGQFINLKDLYLSGNPLCESTTEREKISALLPNVWIEFEE